MGGDVKGNVRGKMQGNVGIEMEGDVKGISFSGFL